MMQNKGQLDPGWADDVTLALKTLVFFFVVTRSHNQQNLDLFSFAKCVSNNKGTTTRVSINYSQIKQLEWMSFKA